MKRIAAFLFSTYGFLWFVVIMLLVFPFIMISLFFGVYKGGNLIYKFCNIWGRIWYMLTGIQHEEIYLAPHNKSKQYIFIANHISYMDIPAIVRCMHQPVRVLGKSEMISIPVFGWIYRAAVILVDRSNPAKRAKSIRAMKAAIQKGISIFIFPEGSFNETGQTLKPFYDGAFKIAIETQTPVKPILFLDTLERLHYKSIFSLTPGKSRCVFLDEINVNGMQPHEVNQLKQTCFEVMKKNLEKLKPSN